MFFYHPKRQVHMSNKANIKIHLDYYNSKNPSRYSKGLTPSTVQNGHISAKQAS